VSCQGWISPITQLDFTSLFSFLFSFFSSGGASWCGPCRALSPIITKVSEQKGVKLVKVDCDANPETASTFQVSPSHSHCPHPSASETFTVIFSSFPSFILALQVSSLPTVIGFKDGKAISMFVGLIPEKSISQFVDFIESGKAPEQAAAK